MSISSNNAKFLILEFLRDLIDEISFEHDWRTVLFRGSSPDDAEKIAEVKLIDFNVKVFLKITEEFIEEVDEEFDNSRWVSEAFITIVSSDNELMEFLNRNIR